MENKFLIFLTVVIYNSIYLLKNTDLLIFCDFEIYYT